MGHETIGTGFYNPPRAAAALAIGLTLALAGIIATSLPAIARLETQIGLGWLFLLRGPRPAPGKVIRPAPRYLDGGVGRRDLFDPAGVELALKPIESFVQLGQHASFDAVASSAANRREIAIGVRREGASDEERPTVINPPKSYRWAAKRGDQVLVLRRVALAWT
jgi:hypothetical protein